MSKKSVYHFDGRDDSERDSGRLGEHFVLLPDEGRSPCFRTILNQVAP